MKSILTCSGEFNWLSTLTSAELLWT